MHNRPGGGRLLSSDLLSVCRIYLPSMVNAQMSTDPNTTEYEMVMEILNAGDRAFLRSILDGENIDYYIQGETVAPYIFHAVPMRLMVRSDQAINARILLDCFVQSHAYGGLKRMLG
jgi:hypothetical protein